jgi:NAD(P)-dependent dehydrogenase (short-subunit alcohol dehydrogenase family)
MHAGDIHDAVAKLHPMGRLGKVEDVLQAILYLERVSFDMSESLNVDGGQQAGRWCGGAS